MKKIFLFVVATLGLTACDKNDDNPIFSQDVVRISATIGESVATRTSGNKWTPGDAIGVFSSDMTVVKHINVKYTTPDGDGNFTGNPIYYHKSMTLTAYYPFKGNEGVSPGTIDATTSAEYQTSEKQSEIDFLYARMDNIQTKPEEVKLEFNHQMSKLTLVFESGNEGTDITRITSYRIDGLVLQGTFNTVTGDCGAKENTDSESIKIDLKKEVEKQNEENEEKVTSLTVPSLILFPQTLNDRTVTLTIYDNEAQEYKGTLKFGEDVIKSGVNYLYTIKVKKTGLSVNSSTIGEWTEEIVKSEANSSDE